MNNWMEKDSDPLNIFTQWYGEVQKTETFEPTAMTLATVDSAGMPSARVVLLKELSDQGFGFFTNYDSVKGQELLTSPKAALVFHWDKPLHRQVRVRGLVEKLSYEQSDAYFQKRSRGSQIGAWSSPQSQEIQSRQELMDLVKQTEERFADTPIPCPENWGGFCLKPLSIEFWQAQEHRLHDRMKFTRESFNHPWAAQRLAP